MFSSLVARGALQNYRKSIECLASIAIYQQCWSATISCDTGNGAGTELIIGVGVSVCQPPMGGCGIKYQNRPCPLCALEHPLGRETEHLICVAIN